MDGSRAQTAQEATEEAAQRLDTYRLERLVVTGFRNYERAGLRIDARPVVLTGDNGAGKTNLLEAVSLLSPGRGLRGATLSDIARKGEATSLSAGGWGVAASIGGPDGCVDVGVGVVRGEAAGDGREERRVIRVEGNPASGRDLAKLLHLCWLTPAMDRLFVESGTGRRKFLDRFVLGFDPEHGTRVNAYERAMRERNALLHDGRHDDRWLAALEETLAETGIAIAAARRETVARLQAAMADASDAFPRADIRLEGEVDDALDAMAAVDAESLLRERFAAGRIRDAGAGRTLDGPHRSDLMVRHVAKAMPAKDCSTGEQKALLIGLLLAYARAQRAERGGAAPVMLLDEVAAHLDDRRRRALFDEICWLGAQAWMTGTDAALFDGLGDRAQHFTVADGSVTPHLTSV